MKSPRPTRRLPPRGDPLPVTPLQLRGFVARHRPRARTFASECKPLRSLRRPFADPRARYSPFPFAPLSLSYLPHHFCLLRRRVHPFAGLLAKITRDLFVPDPPCADLFTAAFPPAPLTRRIGCRLANFPSPTKFRMIALARSQPPPRFISTSLSLCFHHGATLFFPRCPASQAVGVETFVAFNVSATIDHKARLHGVVERGEDARHPLIFFPRQVGRGILRLSTCPQRRVKRAGERTLRP